tara:strand:+ start:843 stop:1244 length:402 start_codon:yes stop_codon:yes gene_type:complete
MEKQKRKKLTQLADKMLDAHDRADELRGVETDKNFSNRVSSLLDSFTKTNSTSEYIDKTKKIISLVSENIIKSEGHNNFDTNEYKADKKKLNDSLFLMQSFMGDKSHDVYSKDNLEKLNIIYRKHSSINKLLS